MKEVVDYCCVVPVTVPRCDGQLKEVVMDVPSKQTKPEFSLRSFHAFIETLNRRCPPHLASDWRSVVKEEFGLTTDQEKSLHGISHERVQEIQDFCKALVRHTQQGGHVHGRISTVPVEEQTKDLAHELHLSLLAPKTAGHPTTQTLMLRIAHCDPDCRNWGWG
jgi:hypothetical protein